MKIRNGFVSNSSSSSFVVLKDALTEEQKDQILNYQKWVEMFIEADEEENYKDESEFDSDEERFKDGSLYWDQNHIRLKYKFEYYYEGYWRLEDHEDFIFGDTSMDNFGMEDYFDHIRIDRNYSMFDEGWNDEPNSKQKGFIQQMKQRFRKDKLKKLNKVNENG